MNDVIDHTQKQMQKTIDHLKSELRSLRSGRANPAMVENVIVEVYGTKMRLLDVATISAPEPRQLLISPFDGKNAQPIAKGIEMANLNLRPQVDGNLVRIRIPEMDASVREKMAKEAKKKCEEAKVAIRNSRREANETIKKLKAEGELPEDMMKKLEKQIQDLTDKFCKNAETITAEKEKEILTV